MLAARCSAAPHVDAKDSPVGRMMGRLRYSAVNPTLKDRASQAHQRKSGTAQRRIRSSDTSYASNTSPNDEKQSFAHLQHAASLGTRSGSIGHSTGSHSIGGWEGYEPRAKSPDHTAHALDRLAARLDKLLMEVGAMWTLMQDNMEQQSRRQQSVLAQLIAQRCDKLEKVVQSKTSMCWSGAIVCENGDYSPPTSSTARRENDFAQDRIQQGAIVPGQLASLPLLTETDDSLPISEHAEMDIPRFKIGFSSLQLPKDDIPVPSVPSSPTLPRIQDLQTMTSREDLQTAMPVLTRSVSDGNRPKVLRLASLPEEEDVSMSPSMTNLNSKLRDSVSQCPSSSLSHSSSANSVDPKGSSTPSQNEVAETMTMGFETIWSETNCPLELAEVWQAEVHEIEVNYESLKRSSLGISVYNTSFFDRQELVDNFWIKHFANPSSKANTIWTGICLLAVIVDLVMIPLQLFDRWSSANRSMLLITSIFWTLDLVLSFFKGRRDASGQVVADFRTMARRYLQTWFAMDLAIIIGDWAFFFKFVAVDNPRKIAGRWLALRSARLLRILRLRHFINRISDFASGANHHGLLAYFTVLRFIVGILILNHITACIFYAIGSASKDSDNWLVSSKLEGDSLLQQYTAAFHFCLAHFTGGEVDITVRTWPERTFACVVLVLGLILVSWLVSTTTNGMLVLAELYENNRKQIVLVRHFCQQNNIDSDLSYRIQKYLRRATQEKGRHRMLHEIEIFALLSEPLLAELHHEIYSPYLSGSTGHPLFKQLRRKAPITMSKICRHTLCLVGLAEGDCAFWPGEIASRMYFILSGTFKYRLHGQIPRDLGEHKYLGEAALWAERWSHRGELQAKSDGDLLTVDSEEFGNTVRAHPRTYVWIRQYARRFVEDLKAACRFSDLPEMHGGTSSDWLCGERSSQLLE